MQETEANPFGDDEEEAATKAAQQPAAGPAEAPYGATTGTVQSFSHAKKPSASGGSSFFSSSKSKEKNKAAKGKGRKPFNLEAEKEQMKSVIADSSIASTNLVNALQSINRERERISENRVAVERFDQCKQLRRRVLRYVRPPRA